jgi:membrane associated rhomboid family serine protease
MIPFRDNIPSRSFPVITVLIIVANVMAFFYELSLDALSPSSILRRRAAEVVTWSQSNGHLPRWRCCSYSMSPRRLDALIGNMLYLWIFGDNIEDCLGHFTFLIFYLLCGLGAGVVHTVLNYQTVVPSIGASGAIAGVLGAYLVSYPRARVLTLVPIFVFVQFIEIPALLVLGFWFVMQFLYGTASLASATPNSGGVACGRMSDS